MLSCKNKKMVRCFSPLLRVVLLFAACAPSVLPAASDIVLPEGTQLTLQLNKNLSTKTNSEGDAFTAVVTTPVYLGDRMAIPKGSVVNGSISRILRPGRFKGKAMMNLRFQSIDIPGRGQTPIVATLVRMDPDGNGSIISEGTAEGDGSTARDAGKVLTPAIIGAGIGTLTGGGKGAGIGAGIGTAIGLASVFTSRGKDLEVHRGSALDIALDRPLTVPSESDDPAARNR